PPSTVSTQMRESNPHVGGLSERTKASLEPSGENLGVVSAAGVCASARILPSATSTRARSAVGQSLVPGDFVWLIAMARPSGDQSNPSAATLRSGGDRAFGGRFPFSFFLMEIK